MYCRLSLDFKINLTVIVFRVRIRIPDGIRGGDGQQLCISLDKLIIHPQPFGPTALWILDHILQSPPGIGEPIGHLDQGHIGSDCQLHFLCLRWIWIVSMSEEPLLQRSNHVLDHSALLTGFFG